MKLLVTALLLLSRVAYADPDAIVRKGFTLELGLAGGGAYYTPQHGTSGHEPGVGLSFTVGGFVRPNLVIAFHELLLDSGPFQTALTPGIAAAATLAVQYWIGDHFHLTGGFGMGIMQAARSNPFGNFSEPAQTGFATTFGASVVPIARPHHALSVSFEVAPIFFDRLISNLYSGSVCWQYY